MARLLTGPILAIAVLGCTSNPAPIGPTQPPAVTQPTSPLGDEPSPGITIDGTSQGSAIAVMPACDLISTYDASTALGVAINASQPSESGEDGASWYGNCLYKRESFGDLVPLELSVAVGPDYVAEFDAQGFPAGSARISGLGDAAAFWLNPIWGLSGPVGALSLKQGDAVLNLTLGVANIADDGSLALVGDGDQQRTTLVDLARIALTRLTSPAPTPAAAATCALISLEQAAGMLGVTLTSANDVDNHDAWGAECQYDIGNELELFIGVNSGPPARQNFDTCKSGGEEVLGIGDEAFYDQNHCPITASGRVIVNALVVRSGDTVLAVGEAGQVGYEKSRVVVADLARLALQRLGLDPGATPAPVAADTLIHPCSLLSDGEVGGAVGISIAAHYDQSDVANQLATCYYSLADSNLYPLTLRVTVGATAVSYFSSYKTNTGYTAVEGVGDEAVQIQSQTDSDQPLVTLTVRSGTAVFDLQIGGNGQSADTFKVIAPGTPAEQLVILRNLAALVLPRLYTPNITPSPSPNSGTSLSLHVQVSHLGTRFEADGHCDIGPDDSWLYLGFQRSGQPEEYLTVGPAPNGVGGMSPKGGGVFHADSVRIALYDSATGALVFAENALAVLQPDLRGVNFNGLWKGATVDVFYTCQ